MNLDLTGKRALVCGSSRGIGHAIATELAALGAECILVARDQLALSEVVKRLPTPHKQQHDAITADFNLAESVDVAAMRALASGKPIHILVNNTGGPPGGKAIDADPQAFIKAFHQHIVAAQIFSRALVPGMKLAGYGRIINIISTSVKAPIPGLGVSNTIRGAMASWAKTLASELGPMGITVNNILPGFTDTDRLKELIAARAKQGSLTDTQVADDMRKSVPMGRFGRTEEIAAAAAFLASPAASYISGINLPVDGGRTPSL